MARKKRAARVPPEPHGDLVRLERWKSRRARAVEIRSAWEREYRVAEGEHLFLGMRADAAERLKFNHFAATLKVSRPNLYFAAPKFFVRPKPGRREPVAERKAAIGEGVLEAIAHQDDNLETAGLLAVLQAYFRLGVLKIIYDPRLEPNPRAGEPVMETRHGEPVLDEAGGPRAMRHPLTGKPIVEADEVLTDETYRWAWVDAANMLLPDDGPDPTRWTWIGEEVVVPLEVAKADPRFPKGIRAALRANKTRRDGNQTRERVERQSALAHGGEEFVEYVEAYDLIDKKLLIWADGQDEDGFLVDEPIPAWIESDPYALLPLGEPILGPTPMPWPVPVVKDWIEPQMEYELRRKQITGGAGRSARKILYTEGAFADEDEARKLLQSPVDNEAVKCLSLGEDKIRPFVDADLNGAIYRDIGFLQSDWRVITGQSGARLADPDADTATEATFVERAANLRDADLQKSVVRWLGVAGRKMLQCVKQTLTLELWIQMREVGDKEFLAYAERTYGIPQDMAAMLPGIKDLFRQRFGQQKWLSITREDLTFEADVTVAPGSTRPKSLDAERRAWLEFLKVLGAAPQLALSRALLEYTADKFEIEDERLLDELTALAEKMVQVNANQAGRNQGGGTGGAPGTTDLTAAMSAMNGGTR